MLAWTSLFLGTRAAAKIPRRALNRGAEDAEIGGCTAWRGFNGCTALCCGMQRRSALRCGGSPSRSASAPLPQRPLQFLA
eukprot:gene17563-biopygen23358